MQFKKKKFYFFNNIIHAESLHSSEYVNVQILLVCFNGLVVDILSSISEVPSSNPSSYVCFSH